MKNEINLITTEQILDIISDYFKISVDDIKGLYRKRSLVIARHFAFYFLRELTEATFLEIASLMHRDHSTIIHGIKASMIYVDQSEIGRKHFFNLKKRFNIAFVGDAECKIVPIICYQESIQIAVK